ncbi:MAG TPA: tetratricopeptide repeat protein [Pyrinomonadaceae bacterium]|nr:tetratricopeptide repeat protein [Pyrinomonadaceae bacterium]
MSAEKSARSSRSVRATLLLLAVLLAALAAVSCTNPEQAKADYLRRGEAFLKERKFQEASIEFRNALQIDDRLAAAHWGLAQAFEGLQRGNEAFDALRRAVELDPNLLPARVRLGTYYILIYERQKKEEFLNESERLAGEVLAKDPNHVEAHVLLANVLTLRGKHSEALAKLQRAIEIDPQRIETRVSLAQFYLRTNDAARAEEAFKAAIGVNERSSLAHVEYGRFLAGQNRHEQAEAEFRRAVEVDPNNRDVRLVLAGYFYATKQLDKAEESYKALAELDRDRPEGAAVLADFYASVNRLDDALRIYQETVAKSPDFNRGHYRIGELLLQRGDLAGALRQAEEVLKKNPNDLQARLLRGRIHLQNGKTKEATEDLREVLKQEPNSEVGLYYMAEASFRAGQVEQARSFAGDLERFSPDFLPARLMQSQISLASGDAKTAERQATELLERLSSSAPNARLSPQLVEELRAKAFTSRGTARVQLGDFAGGRADMESARAAAPNSPASYTNLAAVSLAQNNAAEAATLYERALSIDAANFDALSGLVKTYSVQRRLGDAHARLDQLLAAQPSNASLHFLKAQAFSTREPGAQLTDEQLQERARNAETHYRRALELDPNYIAAYQALGSLYVNTGQPDRAVEEFRRIVERQPDNVSAHTLLGMVEFARGNYDGAHESYRRALQIDPESPIAANNLAMLAADHGKGNLDEALQLAQTVVRRFPEEAGYADTLGWVFYKKGLYQPAVEQLQKAVRLASARGGDNALYRYHLGLALAGAGRRQEARKELTTAQNLAQSETSRGRPFAQADELRQVLASL